MPIRLGDTTKQVNDSTLYPIVEAPEVEVLDTAGNFPPPSIRSYKDLESVLAFLATSGGTSAGTFVASFTNSSLAAGDPVAVVSSDTVDQADATDPDLPAVGICIAVDTPAAGQCTVQVTGETSVFGGLVVGEKYVLSTMSGDILAESDTGNPDYPSASGEFIQGLGIALTSTSLLVQMDPVIELS